MQKMSTWWIRQLVFSKVIECLKKVKHLNEYKTFEKKSITKNYWIQNKWIKSKMLKLKYGNTKLSNVWKYK